MILKTLINTSLVDMSISRLFSNITRNLCISTQKTKEGNRYSKIEATGRVHNFIYYDCKILGIYDTHVKFSYKGFSALYKSDGRIINDIYNFNTSKIWTWGIEKLTFTL